VYCHETTEHIRRQIVELQERRRLAEAEASHARDLSPDLEGPAREAERDADLLGRKIADLERIAERVAAGYPYFERSGFEEAVDACGEIAVWQEFSERPVPGVVYVHEGINTRIPIEVQRNYGKAMASNLFEGCVLCFQFEPGEKWEEVKDPMIYLFVTILTPASHEGRALFLIGQWKEE
jgi:hypothetical protein